MEEEFYFLAKVLARGGCGGGNEETSLPDRSPILTGRSMITGATGIGVRGNRWAVTGEFIGFSQKEGGFWETAHVCTVYPVSMNVELISGRGAAQVKLTRSVESMG